MTTMRMNTGTALIAGHTVQFTPQHRQDNESRPVLTVGVWFPVSVEDLTAAVWVLVDRHGVPLADLADPVQLHTAVVETLFNEGIEVEDARYQVAALTPDSEGGVWSVLGEVRQLVDVFYNAPARPMAVAR